MTFMNLVCLKAELLHFDIEAVFVRYAFNYSDYRKISLEYTTDDIWNLDIIISNSAFMLTYSYIIRDVNGNELDTSISGGEITVDILDVITPTAAPGNDRSIEQYQTIILDGANGTDNVGIIEYIWKFNYDGAEELISEMTTAFSFEIAGTYNISLKVIDDDGNWAMDYFILTVKDIILPVAYIDNIRDRNEGSSVTFKGSTSSDNVGIVNYTWSFVYRGMTIRLYNDTAFYFFMFPGEYNVSLTVTDGAGNMDSKSLLFNILDKSEPSINISILGNYVQNEDKIEIMKGRKIIMDSSSSFDNVGITNWTWTIKSKDGTVERYTETEEYIFEKEGVYTITLSIYDDADNSEEITFKMVVKEPPISSTEDGTEKAFLTAWVYIVIIIVIVLVIIALIFIFLKKRRHNEDDKEEDYHEDRVRMESEIPPEKYPSNDRKFTSEPQDQSSPKQRTQPVPPDFYRRD
jgi:hypothetical protein